MADTAPDTAIFPAMLRRPKLLAAVAGVVTALGQAPVSLPWASLLGLGVAFLLFQRTVRPRRAALLGWVSGCGYFAASLFWIVEPFLVDPVRHGWMAPFALFFTAAGFALFWRGAAGLARWLVGGDRVLSNFHSALA